MRTSARGRAEIVGHEGIVLSPYRDSVGVWTIFVGHTKAAGSPDPRSFPLGQKQPMSLALSTFERDLRKYEDDVNRALKVSVTQTEFDALVSFHYNTGGIARAALLRHLNAGDRQAAAKAFDGWHRPPEIIGRRNAEKRLFRDGVYSHNGLATVYPADGSGRVLWEAGQRVNVLALMGGAQTAPTPTPRPEPPRQPDDPGVEPRSGKEGGAIFGFVLAILIGLAVKFRRGIWGLFKSAPVPGKIAMVVVPLVAALIVWFRWL